MTGDSRKRPTGRDADRDPVTGHPETHAGGMAGGTFAGVVAGSVLGGIAGQALAERFNPQHEDEYWRNEFPRRPYAVSSQFGWDDYWPAYRFGYERFPACEGRNFDEVEAELAHDWEDVRGTSRLQWHEARVATRDAYERLAQQIRAENPQDRDDKSG